MSFEVIGRKKKKMKSTKSIDATFVSLVRQHLHTPQSCYSDKFAYTGIYPESYRYLKYMKLFDCSGICF